MSKVVMPVVVRNTFLELGQGIEATTPVANHNVNTLWTFPMMCAPPGLGGESDEETDLADPVSSDTNTDTDDADSVENEVDKHPHKVTLGPDTPAEGFIKTFGAFSDDEDDTTYAPRKADADADADSDSDSPPVPQNPASAYLQAAQLQAAVQLQAAQLQAAQQLQAVQLYAAQMQAMQAAQQMAALKLPSLVTMPSAVAQAPGQSKTIIVNNASAVQRKTATGQQTSVMLTGLPRRCTRDLLVRVLASKGFAQDYDFLYVPLNLTTRIATGYAFLNMVSADAVTRFWAVFDGFSDWPAPVPPRDDRRACRVTWSVQQGLEENIDRYRNSSLMHRSVPDELRPMIMKDGTRIQFPAPTRSIRAPRLRVDAGVSRKTALGRE